MVSYFESRRRHSIAVFIAIGLGLFALMPGPVGAVTRTPWNSNLLTNGGAEQGPGTNGYSQGIVPAWSIENHFLVVSYGSTGGFPGYYESEEINGGNNFFTTGFKTDTGKCGIARQTVTIHGRGAAIDAGHVKVVVRAYLATYDHQLDTAILSVTTGPNSVASKQASRTNTSSSWVRTTVSLMMLEGQRNVTVTLKSAAAAGSYCDAYFDKVSVKIVKVV
jgi:hypothetical protein